jgi:hypothetical protein
MNENLDLKNLSPFLFNFLYEKIKPFDDGVATTILCEDFYQYRLALCALGIKVYPESARDNLDGIVKYSSSNESISILERVDGDNTTRLIYRSDIIEE